MQKAPAQDATLEDLLARPRAQVQSDLDRWLVEPGTPARLGEAMRYVLVGGKRLRPAIVHLAAEAAGQGGGEMAHRAAVAIELAHVYSLVHDDLPAMDDDALRRGRPTAHVQFGEAMAILVGDALLSRAFGVLAESGEALAGALVAELAAAAGAAGMVAGQVADMGLCEFPAGIEGIRYIHLRKTAAMIRGAARMGARAGGADEATLAALGEYAENLGLAFQLFDDLLDETASAEELGKTPGKDARSGKRTHQAFLGRRRAEQLGAELTARAKAALAPMGPRGARLCRLAELLADRTH